MSLQSSMQISTNRPSGTGRAIIPARRCNWAVYHRQSELRHDGPESIGQPVDRLISVVGQSGRTGIQYAETERVRSASRMRAESNARRIKRAPRNFDRPTLISRKSSRRAASLKAASSAMTNGALVIFRAVVVTRLADFARALPDCIDLIQQRGSIWFSID